MSDRLLILCPGQGGQHAAMFDLARTDADAARFLDRCAPALGRPDAMFENRSAQPSIVAASVAMSMAIGAPEPALVAGYSVGELSAYAVAGSLAPRDAVELAVTRARLMDDAAGASGPQALVALSGTGAARLACGAGFEIAIVTGHDSCIAGGLVTALPALEQAVLAGGARMQRLPVALASHTRLMASAVAPFEAALRAAQFEAPLVAVLSGIGAARIVAREQAISALSRQLSETIRWNDCMDAAAEAGVTVALELGPGAALARMLQARHPGIACRSVEDFRSLAGIRAWLARELA